MGSKEVYTISLVEGEIPDTVRQIQEISHTHSGDPISGKGVTKSGGDD